MFTKLNFRDISTLACHYFPNCSGASFGPSLGIVPCNNDGVIQEVYLSTCLLQTWLSCLLLSLSLCFCCTNVLPWKDLHQKRGEEAI